jgi:hypothetical protein
LCQQILYLRAGFIGIGEWRKVVGYEPIPRIGRENLRDLAHEVYRGIKCSQLILDRESHAVGIVEVDDLAVTGTELLLSGKERLCKGKNKKQQEQQPRCQHEVLFELPFLSCFLLYLTEETCVREEDPCCSSEVEQVYDNWDREYRKCPEKGRIDKTHSP